MSTPETTPPAADAEMPPLYAVLMPNGQWRESLFGQWLVISASLTEEHATRGAFGGQVVELVPRSRLAAAESLADGLRRERDEAREEMRLMAEACAIANRHLDRFGIIRGPEDQLASQQATFTALHPYTKPCGHDIVSKYTEFAPPAADLPGVADGRDGGGEGDK